jgi:hypothetical protein
MRNSHFTDVSGKNSGRLYRKGVISQIYFVLSKKRKIHNSEKIFIFSFAFLYFSI